METDTELNERHVYEAMSPFPSWEYISVEINPSYGVPRKVFCAGKWWSHCPDGAPSGSTLYTTTGGEYALIVKLN